MMDGDALNVNASLAESDRRDPVHARLAPHDG
jgi:hypothetical protein